MGRRLTEAESVGRKLAGARTRLGEREKMVRDGMELARPLAPDEKLRRLTRLKDDLNDAAEDLQQVPLLYPSFHQSFKS